MFAPFLEGFPFKSGEFPFLAFVGGSKTPTERVGEGNSYLIIQIHGINKANPLVLLHTLDPLGLVRRVLGN